MWDFGSQTGDLNLVPALEMWRLNLWNIFFKYSVFVFFFKFVHKANNFKELMLNIKFTTWKAH